MTNLHDARVEEVAEVMADMNGEPRVGRYERTLAAVALKNADAVVTVEMIAETAHKAMQESWTDGGEYEHAPDYIARAVLALIRGGGEQC